MKRTTHDSQTDGDSARPQALHAERCMHGAEANPGESEWAFCHWAEESGRSADFSLKFNDRIYALWQPEANAIV